MKVVIDVINHRHELNPELSAWLDGLKADGFDVRTQRSHYDVCTARRASLANFIENDVPAGATHLLMLDDDMVPVPGTERILTEPGDLVYCGYVNRSGRGRHYGHGDLGCACLRISDKLAASIPIATSFEFVFNASRTEVEKCECRNFRDQARDLGYESKMIGTIGHCVNMVVVPTETGAEQRWPIIG